MKNNIETSRKLQEMIDSLDKIKEIVNQAHQDQKEVVSQLVKVKNITYNHSYRKLARIEQTSQYYVKKNAK